MLFIVASLLFNFGLTSNDGCRPLLDETHFNENFLSKLCPLNTRGKTTTARICKRSKDPVTGRAYDSDPAVKLAREKSLKLAIVNQFYGKSLDNPDCGSFCMYDPVNPGKPLSEKRIGFIWRSPRTKQCWDLVDNWTCYTRGAAEWEVAKRKAQAVRSCDEEEITPENEGPANAPKPAPKPADCTPMVGTESFTPEFLNAKCLATGNTDKSASAKVCANSVDPITGRRGLSSDAMKYWTESLKLTLVNEMYTDCKSFCMYDPRNVGAPVTKYNVGFIWRNSPHKCWDLVKAYTCFTKGAAEHSKALAKASKFCKAEEAPEEKPSSTPNAESTEAADAMKLVLSDLTGIKDSKLPTTDDGLEKLLELISNVENVLGQLKTRIMKQTR